MIARTLSRYALPLSIALVAPALVACGGTVATSEPQSAESAATRAPVAQSTHGPVKIVGDALSDVPLTPAQRAEIEKLAAEAETRHEAVRAARKDMMLAVAAQVETGSLDRASLQPKIDALATAMQAAQPADRAAFERLHAILVPDQRTAFVDALEARIHERMSAHMGKHPMKEWADELKLTEDQRAQLRAIFRERFAHHEGSHEVPPWAEGHERGAKLMRAFGQDRFVMDEVAPAIDVREKAAKMSDHFLGIAQQVLPVLTAEQRAIAAQKIRARAETGEPEPPMP